MGDRTKAFKFCNSAYPLTNIQENLQKLKGATIFTSIDACGTYPSDYRRK